MKSSSIKFLGILLCFCLFLTCCDEDGENSGGSLLGTWAWTMDTYVDCDNSADDYIWEETCDENYCTQYVFKPGGIFEIIDTWNGVSETLSGTYSTKGNQLTITVSQDNYTITITWEYSVNEDELNINLGKDEYDGCTNIEVYTRQ
ncbi:hypothetical protein [Marinoscillum sp. MHG1-6]|uniref:hypothetical protein n=1 Tax=Marinoscillum sp. MHG1-6 TaxID=2959627 RepID=UPI002158284A|nr:hypothetical protein [Marinoscillum sp. MHG1-6]